MKIQRFRAKTTQEALEQARMALGPEALILQTRRGQEAGLRGLLVRSGVEILAAVESPCSGQPSGQRIVHALGERRADAAPSGGRRDEIPASPHRYAPGEWQSELAALRREMTSLRALLSEPGKVRRTPP